MNNLFKAAWMEACYSGARFYSLSDDAVLPSSSVVSREWINNLTRAIAYASLLSTGNETRQMIGREIGSFIE